MLFSEPIFLFFFLPLLLAVHALAPSPLRNAVLAGASILFYAWDTPEHVWILLGSITFNYLIGFGVAAKVSRFRRSILFLGIAGNLAVLGFFKYANFAVANLNILWTGAGNPPLEVAPVPLPLGISFFTFQCISYIADVYRGGKPCQRNPVDMALYVALFPQLIAGPIVRYHEIASQIRERLCSLPQFKAGMARFIVGLVKKVLIADTLARPADLCFSLTSSELTAPLAWCGLVCYTLQIYFDFSGYSDMAIGLGRMFGFRLPENFNFPYIATSVTDFWRRWHLTLSNWFRDYVYVSLGGNRISPNRTYVNLGIVFLLCGLWHGASWTFIMWGMFHGAMLVLERILGPMNRLPQWLTRIITLFAVMIGWVLFRSESFDTAGVYLTTMFGAGTAMQSRVLLRALLSNEIIIVVIIAVVAATPVSALLRRFLADWLHRAKAGIGRRTRLIRIHRATDLALCGLILILMLRVADQNYVPFLYFRF